MTEFTLPFIIESEEKDYLLSKCHEEERETYSLRIEANKHLESPIWIKMNPRSEESDFMIRVELGEGSTVNIIEDWSPALKARSITYRNLIQAARNSSITYVVLNHSAIDTQISEERNSEIDESAKSHIYSYHFGSKRVDSKLQQKTIGPHAVIFTDIITKTGADQDLNFQAEHLYAGSESSGDIEMKGIAEDRAMLNFEGMINIAQSGGGSEGFLNQETLNLSPKTVVKATPGLKIDTNDVKAGHGASVRNLNDDDLYYFGARGIAKEQAKKLLITGFLESGVSKIEKFEPAYQTIKKLI